VADEAAGFAIADGITVLAKGQLVAGTYTGPR
jgi:hypothetical protein